MTREEGSRQTHREEHHKKTYKCLDVRVPPLFLSAALWEKVRCSARVVDVYRARAGAHRHVAASFSWSTSLFFAMWRWSCSFCGIGKSCILPTTIVLAALMMKTFLRKAIALAPHNSVQEKGIGSRPKYNSLSSIWSRHKSRPKSGPSRISEVDPNQNCLPAPTPMHPNTVKSFSPQFQIEFHPEDSSVCSCPKTLRNPGIEN